MQERDTEEILNKITEDTVRPKPKKAKLTSEKKSNPMDVMMSKLSKNIENMNANLTNRIENLESIKKEKQDDIEE